MGTFIARYMPASASFGQTLTARRRDPAGGPVQGERSSQIKSTPIVVSKAAPDKTMVLWRRWRRHNTSYFAATLGGLAAALRATPSHRAPLPGQRPTTMDCI